MTEWVVIFGVFVAQCDGKDVLGNEATQVVPDPLRVR